MIKRTDAATMGDRMGERGRFNARDPSTWGDTLRIVFVAIMAPLVLSVVTVYMARQDKQLDWARQDKVAAKVEAAVVAAALANTANSEKLDVIHKLVNSNLTAALQAEYDARSAELVTLIELTELKTATGKPVLATTLARIAATRSKLAELKTLLETRAAEQRALDAATTADAKGKQSAPVKVEITGAEKPVPVTITPK